MSRESLALVHHLFAWGEDNAALFRSFPGYPGTPIHVTGNPRGDLLRPELRALHEAEARAIRAELGDFVLVNTNFGGVNAFYPQLNFLRPASPGEAPAFGTASVGMTREFAEGKSAHKAALFESFQKLVPALADAFPALTVVVRPHPSERREVYAAIASRHPRVQVRHESGVVPWLLASRALVHNGCTTAVEAYALGVPALAFQPVVAERFDDALPNDLSLDCRGEQELFARLREVLDGECAGPASPARDALLDRFLAARSGRLATERIVDVLEEIADECARLPAPPLAHRLEGRWRAAWRRLVKGSVKARLPGRKNSPAFQRHRFPGMEPAEIERRLARVGEILGRPERMRVTPLGPFLDRIELA
jgi:surface carbohydrate biosynthesis protein